MSISSIPSYSLLDLKDRLCDNMGCGHYGASRGARLHRGIDRVAGPEWMIKSHICGKVTKLGYPYAAELSFRYVEVTDHEAFEHRFFYLQPLVGMGAHVEPGDILGMCQDVAFYHGGGMKNHVHYEVKRGGEYFDPKDWL